jgi:beta-mannosidase
MGLTAWADAVQAPAGAELVATVIAGGTVLARASAPASAGRVQVGNIAAPVWWPNGHGAQPVCTVRLALVAKGSELAAVERPTGFRQVRWKPCTGAPTGARDWLCEVNGRTIFLQGIDWVPLRTCFADVTEAEYRERLTTYRDLGCNIIRVWGGGPLERTIFYRLCDELGLMVWQEFPFSASGLDNHPPADPAWCAAMAANARHYIAARQHHPSLLMWCGGNEMQYGPDGKPGVGRPCDEREPMLAALAAVVAELDPGRRFVPTSASGPRFMADAKEYGQGVHHDVHGPWSWPGDLAGWKAYWDGDDALLRSETGFPGAQSAALTRKHGGVMAWPASFANPYWVALNSWWIQWDDWQGERGSASDDLETYVAWSQRRQAEALAYAVARSQARFPACAGIILWMGHDCHPCPVNTAVIDVEGRPKPAALAVGELFRKHPHR